MKDDKIFNKKPAFGTLEWASQNVNFINGCLHDCLYCYAKSMAIRFGRKTPETWHIEEIKKDKIPKKFGKVGGTIMFPSSHDISLENVDNCIMVLDKMLKVGNNVLVVTKPHLEVVQKLCFHLQQYKNQILFRFTIGSTSNETLKFWEPNAPSFEERLASLQYAFSHGYKTSISCEPALDNNTYELVQRLSPYVTDSIWIGLANRLKGNLKLNGHGDAETLEKANELQKIQSDEWIIDLYKQLTDNPKIRWKDSCKKILQIERPTLAGLDI
jgi:DNA repair photolyase